MDSLRDVTDFYPRNDNASIAEYCSSYPFSRIFRISNLLLCWDQQRSKAQRSGALLQRAGAYTPKGAWARQGSP